MERNPITDGSVVAEALKDVSLPKAYLGTRTHKDLAALAHARNTSMGELLREAVEFFLADEKRKAHEYGVFLRMCTSVKGNEEESTRDSKGMTTP